MDHGKIQVVYRQRTDDWDGSESPTHTPSRSTSPFQAHLWPHSMPDRSQSLRRPSNPPSISSTPSKTDLAQDHGSLSRKKGLWNKLSTSPSSHRDQTSAAMDEFGTKSAPAPSSPGLAKKRSSGQLLSNLNRGLSRVGSVMKRSPSSVGYASPDASPRPTPVRQSSRLGLSKQGSIRRQVEHGSWRGRRLAETPEAVPEEDGQGGMSGGDGINTGWRNVQRDLESDAGDEGSGRPFNVNHDLHISPDLDNLPAEWIRQLKAQGMTEADLVMIAAARQRQAQGTRKAVNHGAVDQNFKRHITGKEISPDGFVTLRDESKGRTVAVRRDRRSTGSGSGSRRKTSLKDSPSRSSTKQRLPALTHLDDSRASMDSAQMLEQRPCQGASLDPPPSSAPPSALSAAATGNPSRRFSDQLRGFASLNLDEVGSWADDVLGLVDEAKDRGGGSAKSTGLRIDAVRAGRSDGGPSSSPKSPRSPGAIKRVPVPPLSAVRKSGYGATSPESTRTGLDSAPGTAKPTHPPFTCSTAESTARDDLEESAVQHTARTAPAAPSWGTPVTPVPVPGAMSMSHFHSQSLSTAEDQEIRTPSTAENEEVHPVLQSSAIWKPEQRWRSTNGLAWKTPEMGQIPRRGNGPLGDAIDLTTTSLSRVPGHAECSAPALSDRRPSTPIHQPSLDYLALTSPTSPHSPHDAEDDFFLSFPSPLRPPPNPHVSLPASASETDDLSHRMDFADVDPDASPILRGGVLSMGSDILVGSDEEAAGLTGTGSAVGSRQDVMPRGFSNTDDQMKASGGKGEMTDHMSGTSVAYPIGQSGLEGPIQLGAGPSRDAAHPPRTSSLRVAQQANSANESRDTDTGEDDRLSPLPPTATHYSPKSISHRPSSRSLRSSLVSGAHHNLNSSGRETDRESMALSTFSGESDADFRDSMLGARVYTAQKEQLGHHQVGRMSVFSLSGYMEGEEAGEAGEGKGGGAKIG